MFTWKYKSSGPCPTEITEKLKELEADIEWLVKEVKDLEELLYGEVDRVKVELQDEINDAVNRIEELS